MWGVYYYAMTMTQSASEAALQPELHSYRDWPYRRSAVQRYGVAVVVTLAAFAIRYAMFGDLMNRVVFTFFVPAALIAAWYGGVGPGLVATVLGLFLGDFFFLPPQYRFGPLGIRESMALGIYIVTTMVCVILCERLHNEIRQFEHALDRERHHAARNVGGVVQAFTEFLDHHCTIAAGEHSYFQWPFQRSIAARYGIAVGMVVLAFALRYWLFGTLDHRFPFIFFVPAAMVATWYGGMAPGLLATAAGLLLGDYFFLLEHEALGPVLEYERIAIGLYAVTTTLCVMLFENLHNRIRRLEHALERARHHHQHPGADAYAAPADAAAAH